MEGGEVNGEREGTHDKCISWLLVCFLGTLISPTTVLTHVIIDSFT